MASDPLAARTPRRRTSKAERCCHLCGRSFTKTEHLERHVRSHTKEKPFVCDVCGRKYSRHDTLLRHKRDHLVSKASNERSSDQNSNEIVQSRSGERSPQIDPNMAVPQYDPFSNSYDSEMNEFSASNFMASAATPLDGTNLDFEAQFPSWLMDEDFHVGLLDTPLVTSMAELGSGWPHNLPSTSGARDSQEPKSLKHIWFTNIEEVSDSQPNSGGPPTPVASNREVDDNYRQALRQRLEVRPVQQSLPSADFLNLCVRSYFARFHPVFPIVHAPTFRPSKANSMLLLSICSVGSLFTGSTHAVRQGIDIFERLHKAVLANWERLIARGTDEAISMVQTAIIGQTFGLLSGDPKHLAIVDAFHGTCISWARKCGAFASIPSTSLHIGDAETEIKWRKWAKNEELRRIALGLHIHDAELADIFHHDPFLRHDRMVPIAASHTVFMSSRAEEWRQHYQTELTNSALAGTDATVTPDVSNYGLIPANSQLTAYALLYGIIVAIVEYRTGNQLGHVETQDILNRLLAFNDRFLRQTAPREADHLDMSILWHMAFMSLFTNFDLLERAIGREGAQISDVDQAYVVEWANSEQSKRCVIHGTLILKKLETMPFGFEPAIHVPRAMFRAGIAWFCYTRFGNDAQSTSLVGQSNLDFPELKAIGVNPAFLLFEANGYKHGRPTAIEANGALCGLTDLLQRIGHWEIARKFATILGALIHNEAGEAG